VGEIGADWGFPISAGKAATAGYRDQPNPKSMGLLIVLNFTKKLAHLAI
jgi:hypothetical protein